MAITQTIPMSETQEPGGMVPDGPARGAYDVTFDALTGVLTVSGAFENLAGALSPVGSVDSEGNPQSAIHMHVGRAGQNGPILRNLTVVDNGDGSGTFSGTFTLTAAQAARFHVRELYVNIHTTAFAGGELRGQMTPFDVDDPILAGAGIPLENDQQPGAGPTEDGSSGDFGVTYNAETRTLSIFGDFSGVASALVPIGAPDAEGNPGSSMHVHLGSADDNGAIVRNLTVVDNGDGSGTFGGLFMLTEDEAKAFLTGQFYINQHTADDPGGAIRGQVIPQALVSETLTAQLVLEESQEVTPPADTAATAGASIVFHTASNTLFVEGAFSSLSGALAPVGAPDSEGNPQSAIHLHLGAAGTNGGIIRNMTVTDNGDGSGTFAGLFSLSDAEAASLAAGNLYFNIHTAGSPGGELRGQIFADDLFVGNIAIDGAALEEAQEIGMVADTEATGSVSASLDPLTNILVVDGSFSDLAGALAPVGAVDAAGNPQSAIHVHLGAAGTNGPIIRNLTVTGGGDGSGTFSGRFALTDAEAAAYRSGLLYVNVHTVGSPGGELRGQLFEAAQVSGRLAAIGIPLEERQEVGTIPPDGPGTGAFNLLFDPETGSLKIAGTFSDLTSPLAPVGATDVEGNPQSAAHLHIGAAGTNGPIARNLSISDNGGGDFTLYGEFTLSNAEIAAFLSDGVYINLHTAGHPGGGLRGQIFSTALVSETFVQPQDNLLGLTLTGTAGDDQLSGFEGNDRIDGRDGSDSLSGGDGFDVLIGGAGDDVLDGGSNPENQGDFLLGGTGNDVYHVDSGLDFVDEGSALPEFGGGGFDTIISTTDFFWDVYGVGEAIRISEDAPDGATTLVAGIFNNFVVGNSGDNVLFGRGGSDTYIAGDGIDFISFSTLGVNEVNGYAGVDGINTLVVEDRASGAFSYDILFEFESGKDRLDVTSFGYASAEEAFATGVDDGLGNSYFALGDGFDYLYVVGLELSDLSSGDFIV